jgi:predicted dehydrogenase
VYFVRTGWLRKRKLDTPWIVQKEMSGGGVFLDLGIVMLDMALWMMGYPVVKRVGASHYNHKTHQVEDTSLVSLTLGRFPNVSGGRSISRLGGCHLILGSGELHGRELAPQRSIASSETFLRGMAETFLVLSGTHHLPRR